MTAPYVERADAPRPARDHIAGLVCHHHGHWSDCGYDQPCSDGYAAADAIQARPAAPGSQS